MSLNDIATQCLTTKQGDTVQCIQLNVAPGVVKTTSVLVSPSLFPYTTPTYTPPTPSSPSPTQHPIPLPLPFPLQHPLQLQLPLPFPLHITLTPSLPHSHFINRKKSSYVDLESRKGFDESLCHGDIRILFKHTPSMSRSPETSPLKYPRQSYSSEMINLEEFSDTKSVER